MIAFLVVEPAKAYLVLHNYVSNISALIVSLARCLERSTRFGAVAQPDDRVPQLLPPGKGPVRQFAWKPIPLILSRFTAFLGERRRSIPDTEDLRHYLDHLYQSGLSSRSIARHLTTLRSFYGFLLREGLIETDPTEHLRTPSSGRTSLSF